MARGDGNRGRGFRGGPRTPNRGRGRGRGGGGFRGRGRGGRGGFVDDEMDFNVQMYADTEPTQRSFTPRGRGRGQYSNNMSYPSSGANTPARGRDSPLPPRGRGRGRGRGDFDSPRGGRGAGPKSKLRPDGPLSGLLYQERPFLRPVIFVPSVHTRTLFEEGEEILKPGVEDADETEQSHVPTAERVTRVFSGNVPRIELSDDDDEENDNNDEEIEEIDFNDMAKLLEMPVVTKASTSAMEIVEERFTGFFIDTNSTTMEDVKSGGDAIASLQEAPSQPMEEIEFGELHKLVEKAPAAIPTGTPRSAESTPTLSSQPTPKPLYVKPVTLAIHDQPTGFRIDPNPTPLAQSPPDEEIRFIPISSPAREKDDALASVEEGNELTEEQPSTATVAVDSAADSTPTVEIEAPTPLETPVSAAEDVSQQTATEKSASSSFFVNKEPTSLEAAQAIERSESQNLAPSSFIIEVQPSVSESVPMETTKSQERTSPAFFIDTEPTPMPDSEAPVPLSPGDQEEIIVYVAPHPRSTAKEAKEAAEVVFEPYIRAENIPSSSSIPGEPSSSRIPAAPAFSSISFSSFSQPAPSPSQRRANPVATPRAAKAAKARERKKARRAKGAARGTFGSYGAMMEEAMLRGGKKDHRRTERRRGDSDLEWGTESEGDDLTLPQTVHVKGNGKQRAIEDENPEAEGMEVDPELELDVEAMRRFVGGLMGPDAGQFMTMDDIRDGDIMKMEDEDEQVRGSSGEESSEDEDEEDVEVEAIVGAEEAMLIGEEAERMGALSLDDDEDSDDDDSEDEEATPRTSFQARLERLRSWTRGKKHADASFEMEDSDDEDDDFNLNMTWAEKDDDFIAKIQNILDENEGILTGRDRKERNKLFRAVRDGNFEDMDGFQPAKRRKDKGKDLPPDLKAQWEKDRQKKAELKRARELARLEQAADPLAQKKGGKKGRKAMLAASRLDPTITVIPNRIIDMVTLVQQIRRFLLDAGGPSTMSLPPTNKETRKNIHEMAIAFGLKSVSKGKGDARYTTLTKTSRSGMGVDEFKISKIVRRSGGAGSKGDQFMHSDKRSTRIVVPKHREGDEVGKAAPKIGQSNIGFKMLASMGWAEGDRIGATGGLEVPLTAIIKNTKLGLGATR
ncbi:hypothetical protein BDQ12DRAFT_672333 [Crucibulum laeve]|uniref:Protein SQS1 n=1 Tax=Crucibulum laeve TaxID=68775 RepID=A0A5C3MI77_9AGAR|nr:hypothetical protein BDQ12DRAFT_672333 [Crucibulum laeve]